ncbi:CopG family transcriptional regulator [Nocardia beijingensis]|uniref:CopG family transcriptional regulator n=1 Tax=Nocardia beijingensis TaxID=95162 RepID=A0ABW7WHN5_9NOCA
MGEEVEQFDVCLPIELIKQDKYRAIESQLSLSGVVTAASRGYLDDDSRSPSGEDRQ